MVPSIGFILLQILINQNEIFSNRADILYFSYKGVTDLKIHISWTCGEMLKDSITQNTMQY
jgi:hypothetical protein